MKMKKIITSTFLTGLAGLTLVACGSKNAAAELVDENGKKYTVEETDEPDEVVKVLTSIATKALTSTDGVDETKYGIDIKANAKIGFENTETEDKYSIALKANADLRTEFPAPEVDEETDFVTETFNEYISRVGLSTGLSIEANSNLPGLTLDSKASVDIYTDEENIYVKLGDIELSDLANVVPQSSREGISPADIIALTPFMSNQKFFMSKEAAIGLIPMEDEEDVEMLESFAPMISSYYDGGIPAIISIIMGMMMGPRDKYKALETGLTTTSDATTTSDSTDVTTSAAPTPFYSLMIQEFVETFNVEISKVDGNEVTFSTDLPSDFVPLMKDYFDEDPDLTHDEIAEYLDDEDLEAAVTLSITLDVKNVRPVQVKVVANDLTDMVVGYIDKITRPREDLRDLTSLDTTSTSETTLSPYDANKKLLFETLAVTEVTSATGEIVIDFLYGKNVNTLSDAAKKDYKTDLTPIIQGFIVND